MPKADALLERITTFQHAGWDVATMPLDEALDYIVTEPVFWIHA